MATDGSQSVPFRTQMFDAAGNMARTWILFFQKFIAGASNLIHAGAVPMVGAPGALVESAISDDGATVAVTGRATTLGGTLAVTGNVKAAALVGVGGAGAALYPLDIRVGAASSGIHVCATDNDKGLYLRNGTNFSEFSHGASFNGTNWVAKEAIASIFEVGTSGMNFYVDTGLTPGNTYTPTLRFSISTTGAVVATGDVTGNSITLSSRVTHGAALTGTAVAGVVTGTVT